MSALDRKIAVGGLEVPADLRAWDPALRHLASLAAMAAASALVILGILLYVVAPGATWVTWLLVVLLFLVLALEAGIVLTGIAEERRTTPRLPPRYPEAPAKAAEAPKETPREVLQVLTLQCSECGTVFDLEDDGTRPLVHRCPGCGAEGTLEEDDLPKPAGTAEPAPTAAEAPVTWEDDEGPMVEAPPVKRLKLRCGGCGTVFVVEDDGTRPLRHACPGCGRSGELN